MPFFDRQQIGTGFYHVTYHCLRNRNRQAISCLFPCLRITSGGYLKSSLEDLGEVQRSQIRSVIRCPLLIFIHPLLPQNE